MNVFHHNAPRPPVVPGEETAAVDGSCKGVERLVQQGPALTPRTSSLYQHHSFNDGCAPLGFEPEGESCGSSGGCGGEGRSPPSYLAWARDLHSLLSDPEGVALFRRYLGEEGAGDTLDFWFACAGLRKQAVSPPDKVSQIVRVIYRRFFLKTQLEIDESLRKDVHRRLKDGKPLDIHVFDEACASVEKLITETTYPNFLKSDLYLQHVQAMQNGLPSNGSSSGSGEASADGGCASGALATLHEDRELDSTPSFPPLTRDMLFITQERRAAGFRPKTEAFAGLFNQGANKGGARAYSSYNPVSRQDSELQSLSSDARTESDNLSLTDSSIDGASLSHHRMSRKQYQRHCQRVKESASINRDPYMHQTLIPRTQRIQTEKVHPMKPEQFAAVLIKKLENLKRSQEIQEKLDHKLSESIASEGGGPSAKTLADAIRERFQLEDDNDQDILDQHVSRVWSDLTPSRTPGLSSPRPKSPDFRRTRSNQPMNKVCVTGTGQNVSTHLGHHHPVPVPHPYQSSRQYNRHVRPKDKDVFSTFSSDSGNVHDFSETLDYRLPLPKSKSMPDYSESSDAYSSLPSHDGRFRGSREWMGSSGRRYSKKPELTDSGVSVVSESASNHGSLPPNKDSRVITWLRESDRTGGCCTHSERDSASSCSGGSRFDGKHHSRGRRSPPLGGSFSGDMSLQPSLQAEELRRRLDEQARCKQTRQRCGSGSVIKGDSTPGSGSTLKKGKSPACDGFTTVVFSFCDEQFPYRSKIPGHSITLRQFKEFLPKKGNYRYFFKTECEELDMQVIQEEITDDNEILPLWEGKVMAQVKPVD